MVTRGSLLCALAGALLLPASASAQLGWALGVRSAKSDPAIPQSGDRRGYEARVTYDRDLNELFGLRADFGYNQMQFQRDDSVRFQVSENGFEFALMGRLEVRNGALTGLHSTFGPIASFRSACGSSGRFDSNGRVLCDTQESYLTGFGVGVGYRWMAFLTSDVTVEARYLTNVTAAQGRDLVAFSIGVRRRVSGSP
ncbi:MAG: outer membrane beta-barrel protein [Gemmatimonadaceae bacterium]|nr:outer membrane beta-barrel protein [Gemmatimonadaceae bacterium]